MKLTILAALCTLFSLQGFAQVNPLSQDFKISTGTPYPVVDGLMKEYFSDGKSVALSVKTQGRKVTILRYDFTTMKEVGRQVYEDFPDNSKGQKMLELNGKLYYIFHAFNKEEGKVYVYAREISWTDGKFKPYKLLFNTSREVTISYYLEDFTSIFTLVSISFDAIPSYDGSKVLFRYRLKPLLKDDKMNFDELGLYVFDGQLEKQWGGEVKMPYTEKKMRNLAYAIGKDGRAHILASNIEAKTVELLSIKPDLKLTVKKILISEDIAFNELALKELPDGNLSVLGYYANGWFNYAHMTDPRSNFNVVNIGIDINGIFQCKITPDARVLEEFKIEFPIELINQYESERQRERNIKQENNGTAGINDLRMINIDVDSDGNTTVIGEIQFMINDYVGNSQRATFCYYEVVATKFDKKGKVLWQKKLPKYQEGKLGRGGMGIRYIKGKSSSYILYLDNIKNAELPADKAPSKHVDGKGGYLTMYKINNTTGNVEKDPIVNTLDISGVEAFQFKTSRIFNASDNIFLLEIYIKDKQDIMVKLELKD
ncbi:MAG: hypothetical protein K0R51_2491 [Cytophagaceae bacterium]|nr:hypothetical protein [Cytophagaceae bacterium]